MSTAFWLPKLRSLSRGSVVLLFAVKQKFGDKYLDEESESSSSESEDDDARVSGYINVGN